MPAVYSYNSIASTPSLADVEPEAECSRRRGSNGTPMTPEVDADVESDGFYMLKKDSQRRTTLVKVLQQDGPQICDLWMQKIREKYLGETVLNNQHLEILMNGLKSYIADPSPVVIEPAIRQLKEELGSDAHTMSQLHFAIYLYQESVNEILRRHPIKPHWMFALDNLVRSGMQAAIVVLSPELQENLEAPNPSTSNSTRTTRTTEDDNGFMEISENIARIRNYNYRLLEQLHESTEQIGVWLQRIFERDSNYKEELKRIWSTRFPPEGEIEEDGRLGAWLVEKKLYPMARSLVSDGYTLDDVLLYMTREELQLARLKPGVEYQVWKAIWEHRAQLREKKPAVTTEQNSSLLAWLANLAYQFVERLRNSNFFLLYDFRVPDQVTNSNSSSSDSSGIVNNSTESEKT
ncbi:mitogen-activated protein kinase kinase kinase 5-like isoform X2 [Agrilus planipennis]|uniref:Mitogen-activated protein kinase kinase kinase 5-like isoform X2 n=1 Tax=Agrilus planipennis TaxID=224129 RepID=A0A7F5R0J4_AGRPL|nr:mitogen-activated protein kinase kinase kinase 5-like isoform X2 [Agrilus planipennis]